MLHRVASEGLILVTQPAHAWVSGQLAHHWGNQLVGGLSPRSEVCLAAELHDLGFVDWESSPTFNPQTGLPHTFLELPTKLHLSIWSQGIRDLVRYGRYPAWLVSRHFTWLCETHPAAGGENHRLEKDFIAEQEELQTTLLTSLQNDFYYARWSDVETLARNRQLVSLWDWMSLLLCLGFHQDQSIPNVPAAEGMLELNLKPLNPEATRIQVAPWPFKVESLSIACDGRQILRNSPDEHAMREALRLASPVTLKIDLVPG